MSNRIENNSKIKWKLKFMSSKNLYIILALINKIILPSYSKRRLNLSKANKLQLGIIYWRYLITRKALK